MKNKTKNEGECFEEFISALSKLSEKTGVVIQSIGGVSFYTTKIHVTYNNDFSSGDLLPIVKI